MTWDAIASPLICACVSLRSLLCCISIIFGTVNSKKNFSLLFEFAVKLYQSLEKWMSDWKGLNNCSVLCEWLDDFLPVFRVSISQIFSSFIQSRFPLIFLSFQRKNKHSLFNFFHVLLHILITFLFLIFNFWLDFFFLHWLLYNENKLVCGTLICIYICCFGFFFFLLSWD